MTRTLLRFPAKRLRADYLVQKAHRNGSVGLICFSCGNSSAAIRQAVLDAEKSLIVLDISPHGDLTPNRWFTQGEINRIWPDFTDGTSGHINGDDVPALASMFRAYLGNIGKGPWYIPTGSGETVAVLARAYPQTEFVPVYNLDEYTRYEKHAPLNKMVSTNFQPIYDPTGIQWTEKHY